MEDCGSSSTESEYWAEYLTDFPEESLSPVQISTDGIFYDRDEDISVMDYAEASNSLWKDWTMNSMLDYDLEKAQSNTWIDEPLLDAILSEASSESGMDLLEWGIINDTLPDEKVTEETTKCVREKIQQECKDQAPASQSRSHQHFASQQERLSASKNNQAQNGTKAS
ncbi:hypothetical protein DL98DRAFT_595354 [Cadophora sp. DSE1049]|nr:hypothetical protein DL98DRAFT_595354 [Cadophora sp. DSE1049]